MDIRGFVEAMIVALALYGFVSLWLLLVQRIAFGYRRKSRLHIYVLVQDSEAHVERLYRMLRRWSRVTNQPLAITFIDGGSRDDTLPMLYVLAKNDDHVRIERVVDLPTSEVLSPRTATQLIIDLRAHAYYVHLE